MSGIQTKIAAPKEDRSDPAAAAEGEGVQQRAGGEGGPGEGGPVAPAAAEERLRRGRGLLHAQREQGAQA